jgi:1-acyl-sn-glycerol-3-phosphate acyltransferase
VKPPRDASLLWKLLHVLITLIRPLLCRLTVEGRERMPPAGGCVIASNHTLGPDYVVLGYASLRQVYYMAKMEIFAWHPLLTRFLAAIGTFPVQRGRGDIEAMNKAVEVVRSGKVLGMFPEGTRSRTGRLMRGKTGTARIALLAQAPVVPAVVLDSHLILKRFGQFWRRPHVVVRFGEPLHLTGDPDDPTETRRQTERIMREIAALLPPERRGVYADTAQAPAPEPQEEPSSLS